MNQLYQPFTELCHWELNENILRDEQTKVTHISITHARKVSTTGVHKVLCDYFVWWHLIFEGTQYSTNLT